MTELVTIHLNTTRILSDTTISGASSEDERTLRGSVDYELLRNVILQANIGYENDIFKGTSRDDRITTVGLGAKYLINQRMSLYGRYDHGGRDSTIGSTNFADNLVTAGIALQY